MLGCCSGRILEVLFIVVVVLDILIHFFMLLLFFPFLEVFFDLLESTIQSLLRSLVACTALGSLRPLPLFLL